MYPSVIVKQPRFQNITNELTFPIDYCSKTKFGNIALTFAYIKTLLINWTESLYKPFEFSMTNNQPPAVCYNLLGRTVKEKRFGTWWVSWHSVPFTRLSSSRDHNKSVCFRPTSTQQGLPKLSQVAHNLCKLERDCLESPDLPVFTAPGKTSTTLHLLHFLIGNVTVPEE